MQIDDLEAAVKANTDAEESAALLLGGLSAQIAALKTTQTDPATAARIDAAVAALNAAAPRLSAAVTANT